MNFIGQKKIVSELDTIANHNSHLSILGNNFLFRGYAGYGKTTLATEFIEKFFHSYVCQVPEDGKIIWNRTAEQYPAHFIDEVHRLNEHSFETLYPLMDSKKYLFVFATNTDVLPVAFTTRCFKYIFSSYTDDELFTIFSNYSRRQLSPDIINYVVTLSRGNPRIGKHFIDKIELMRAYKFSKVKELFGDEFREEDLEYLKLLEQHKRLSRNSIKRLLRFDDDTLDETERFLLSKNKIVITPKGRELSNETN